MVPLPGPLAAMLAAATRSRCPACPQCGQVKFRPAGLGTRRAQRGQVEDVPRSSTRRTVIPAASALSDRVRIRCPTRQSRVRWLCRRPALRCRTPRGFPTARAPIIASPATEKGFFLSAPVHAALGMITNSDGKPADHASIADPASGGNPGGFLGYATAWLEYQLRGNATAAGAFTGPHPELTANPNWPGSAVK